jgi:peptide/nickel transport system substrate-binding protein
MVTRVMDRIFATAETIAHPVLVPAILVPAIAIVVFMAALASSLAAANDVAADTAANAEMAKEKGWPLAWFEPPKTASELGITHFKQSPMLDGLGLPPVADRLPDDPIVLEPYGEIGRHGGKAIITLGDSWQFFNWEPSLTFAADMRTLLPNLAEHWTVSEDGRTTTITLRRGLKWSDGVPLTSDDFMFTFNHIWMDNDMSPVTSRLISGGRIERVDDLTFRYVFTDPNPLFVNFLAQRHDVADPAHYFRHIHPAFTDRVIVDKRVEDLGFITWMAMVSALRGGTIEESAQVPTLRAFKIVGRSPITVRFERNPYYPKVDRLGQQLPYIDTIDAEAILDNAEVVTAKAVTGQLDFAAFTLRTQDIPLLKLGERTGLIKVHIWERLHTSDVVIQFNFNHPDQKLRDLYWDDRFRKALSHAIYRDEMNDIIYFSRGTPSQVSVHPSSAWYEEELARAHLRYDPAYANQLLDEMGLHDIDGDAMREYADGTRLIITMEFLDFETPKGISMDLILDYWRAIGIDLRLKLVDRSLMSARAQAGEMQMSLWHAGRVTDILFPLTPDWWVPRTTGWWATMWNDWARYYQTDGTLGEKPPPIIRQLQTWTDDMRTSTDPVLRLAAGRKMTHVGAEKLWTVGTVGLAPHPVVISKRLKNVIPNGIWGWDNRWTMAYHPATWYFE